MKLCRSCNTVKADGDFYKDRGCLRAECKDCVKRKKQERYRDNPSHALAINRKYLSSERGKNLRGEWNRRRAKTDKFRQQQRLWALTDKGRANRRKRVNQYAQTPKGRAAIKRRHAARRAREQAIINTLTAHEWSQILTAYGNRCVYCGVEFTKSVLPTQDHVKPVSKGGNHTRDNVVPACRPCNSRKKDKYAATSS